MFKCVVTEYYGPFNGFGGYGSCTKVGFNRSPKRAVEIAKSRRPHAVSVTNNCGGGVPILGQFLLYKNGKLILDRWD
jgi:hypothetical protein